MKKLHFSIASPINPDKVYVSDSSSKTWTHISRDLPDLVVSVIFHEPNGPRSYHTKFIKYSD